MPAELVLEVLRGAWISLQDGGIPAAGGQQVAAPGHGAHPCTVAQHRPHPAHTAL